MIVSFNEISAMGKRAARGAGMSWGLADDAGQAARWLAEYGLPGPELLADLLDGQDRTDYRSLAPESTEGPWSAPGGRLCPIVVGAALCDRARQIAAGQEIEMAVIAQPALLAAHVAAAATFTSSTVELAWDDVVMRFACEGVSIEGTDTALSVPSVERVRCRKAEALGRPTTRVSGGHEVDPDRWRRLGEFAHRTYAPSTEESRLSGAGAGLIDD